VSNSKETNINDKLFVKLFNICLEKDFDKLENILSNNPSLVYLKNSLGESFLHIFAQNGDLECIKYFYNKGAIIDEKNCLCNATPLSDSLLSKNKEIVKFFLDNGASVNNTYDIGNSILHEAVKIDNLEIVKILIDYGADIYRKNDLKENLLHISIENNNNTITKFLIDKGVDFLEKDVFGNTPLKIAKEEQNEEILNYLKTFSKTKKQL